MNVWQDVEALALELSGGVHLLPILVLGEEEAGGVVLVLLAAHFGDAAEVVVVEKRLNTVK
jgi:hypothetical protein